MEHIAVIIGSVNIYWSSVVLTMACGAAVCMFLGLYLSGEGNIFAAAIFVPSATALSLVFARLVHWYCRSDSYSGLKSAMDLSAPGGFALMGVFAGCLIAACILRLVRLADNLPELLDCASAAGAFGIALGRLASFFNTSDRGMIFAEDPGSFWVRAVGNPVSGETEYRLATFLLQSGAAAVIFLVLLLFLLTERQRKNRKHGDAALLFLLCYGASQVILDSTRYDSLYFRSNGFVSVVQVMGAVAIAVPILIFSVRMVRSRGFQGWQVILWSMTAACFVLAGYMEYYVQRRSNETAFAYSMMGCALSGVLILTLVIRSVGTEKERRTGNIPVWKE